MKKEKGVETQGGPEEMLGSILVQTIRVKRLLKRFAPIVSDRSLN